MARIAGHFSMRWRTFLPRSKARYRPHERAWHWRALARGLACTRSPRVPPTPRPSLRREGRGERVMPAPNRLAAVPDAMAENVVGAGVGVERRVCALAQHLDPCASEGLVPKVVGRVPIAPETRAAERVAEHAGLRPGDLGERGRGRVQHRVLAANLFLDCLNGLRLVRLGGGGRDGRDDGEIAKRLRAAMINAEIRVGRPGRTWRSVARVARFVVDSHGVRTGRCAIP